MIEGWTGGCIEIASDELTANHEERVVRLTKREIEVLQLIVEGSSSKEAAVALCCSKRTIDFHLARVYEKLDVSNRVQAMRRAAVLGLIPQGARRDEGPS